MSKMAVYPCQLVESYGQRRERLTLCRGLERFSNCETRKNVAPVLPLVVHLLGQRRSAVRVILRVVS